MKKLSIIIIIIAVITACLPSCSAGAPYSEGEGELNVVASSFIPFDFARAVTGGKAKITVLQTSGADIHDYTPTTASLGAIAKADVFICIGGLSDDAWIDAALKASGNTDVTIIRLLECADEVLAELEGHNHSAFCEQNHTHNHDGHDHNHSIDDGHNHVSDEHIWTSPKNAIEAIEKIAKICAEKDSENGDTYLANAKKYIDGLAELDKDYETLFAASEHKTLVFADRFPFAHLMHSYGGCYFAAFSGCSSEISAGFDTVVRLSEAVSHGKIKYVIVTEDSDLRLAKSIADANGCQILTLNSLQSVSLTQIKSGITYLDTMKANLTVLKEALS
jgi:zinc transport system substrate-binding protein